MDDCRKDDEKMTFKELQEKVLEWADSHDLLHEENAEKQFMKFIEEVFEFKTEFDFFKLFYNQEFKDNQICLDLERKLKLEMGDIIVTLVVLCEDLGIDPMECLEMAYDKIKDRKGKTMDGVFIKAEDLE